MKILIITLLLLGLTSCFWSSDDGNTSEKDNSENTQDISNDTQKQEEQLEEMLNEIMDEEGNSESSSTETSQAQVVEVAKIIPEVKMVETPVLSLKERLTPLQYEVTQNGGTETPYENAYWDNKQEGIYVDLIDGVALFSSTDKYKSYTGWPSFTKPILAANIKELPDNKLWIKRTEIKGASSDSHIGHIFTDGPKDKGGLRYCVNSASLVFIAKDDLTEKGYQNYTYLFE